MEVNVKQVMQEDIQKQNGFLSTKQPKSCLISNLLWPVYKLLIKVLLNVNKAINYTDKAYFIGA